MSYSMMFKKSFILLLLLLIPAWSVNAQAKEEKHLPDGEVLIVYADDASEDVIENVYRIVEMLTYEGVETVFAPAARCAGRLSYYDTVIFYELKNYHSELIGEMNGIEKKSGNQRFLFIGNHFLKEYLNRTGRSDEYTVCEGEAGTLTYDFGEQNRKQSLVTFEELLFLKGDHTYAAGCLQTGMKEGYFFADWNKLAHTPVSDLSNPLVLSAFTKEFSIWKQKDREVEEYAQYIVFDKVYPFQNPEKLFGLIKEMTRNKIPFVISVMPIYIHGDYPAMQHFCEVLRFAQDNGGVIILHAPVNQMEEFDVDMVNESLSLAARIYMEHGVYPMGLQVPENWMTNSSTAEVMSRFQTILVSEETDGQLEADWKEAECNLANRYDHQWIAPAISLNDKGIGCLTTYSTAVYLDINEDLEQLEQRIDACENSFVPVKNLWEISHSLYTNTDTISYQNGKIYLNGKQVDKAFVPTQYEEDFAYNRNQLQRFSRDLTRENHKLLTAVVLVTVLFVIFIIIARRNNRSRFFYDDGKDDMDVYWENKK